MWVNAELNASDAFVAVWLPGSEGDAVADVLFSHVNTKLNTEVNAEVNVNFSGKLSYSWPAYAEQSTVNRFDEDYQPLLPYGFGLRYGDENVLSDDLLVTTKKAAKSLQTITLFESAIKAPWSILIADKNSSKVMNSSVNENTAVYIRTIDRNVQEDARRVVFNGSEQGSVAFSSQHAIDLSPYKKAKAKLEVTIRLPKEAKLASMQGVYFAMGCGEKCQGRVDTAKALTSLKVNQWQTLSIDLQCFEESGVDMSHITQPFIISASSALTIDFTDVFIKPSHNKTADTVEVSCQ